MATCAFNRFIESLLGAGQTTGMIFLIVVETGLITPPVGMNVFVINSMAKDVPMIETFRGVIPFLLSDTIRVAFIILFPIITLMLPRLLVSE